MAADDLAPKRTEHWARRLASCLVAETAWLTLGAVDSLVVLRFLHGTWRPWLALAVGALGALGVRHLGRAGRAAFPAFLRVPIDIAVAVLGVLAASLATLGLHGIPHAVARLPEALAVAVVLVLLGLATAALVYTHGRFGAEMAAARRTEDELREAALAARLRALQAQVNPHFLFNALNALAELTRTDPEAAEQLVEDLAFLLRYSLRSSAEQLVPLAQELEAVRRYLRVEQARLGARLCVDFEVSPAAESSLLPGMILQPLVENAVKHAVASRARGGRIRVAGSVANGRLRLTVEDDGPGPSPAMLQHFAATAEALTRGEMVTTRLDGTAVGTGGAGGGLASVQQRLALAYRGRSTLSLQSPPGGGTRLDLEVPA